MVLVGITLVFMCAFLELHDTTKKDDKNKLHSVTLLSICWDRVVFFKNSVVLFFYSRFSLAMTQVTIHFRKNG